MRPSQFSTLSAVAVSGNTAYPGNAMQTNQMVSASAQIITTGTLTGTAQLQFSNDEYVAGNPTNWTNVPGASNTVAISGAGTYAIPVQDVSYMNLRVQYTNATNTGTVTANIKGNGF